MKHLVLKYGTYALVMAGLVGCAVGGGQDGEDGRAAERWRTYKSGSVTAPAENAASVVFLREEGALT